MPFTVADKIEPKLKFSTDYSTGDFEFWRQIMLGSNDVDPMTSPFNAFIKASRRLNSPIATMSIAVT